MVILKVVLFSRQSEKAFNSAVGFPTDSPIIKKSEKYPSSLGFDIKFKSTCDKPVNTWESYETLPSELTNTGGLDKSMNKVSPTATVVSDMGFSKMSLTVQGSLSGPRKQPYKSSVAVAMARRNGIFGYFKSICSFC